MRRPRFNSHRSATMLLLIINVVAFGIQFLFTFWPHIPVNDYFALSSDGLRHGYIWQLLTFQFMHGNWFHLLCNCVAIYIFGREVEEALGWRSFLVLYFASGVIGGLVQALAGMFLGGQFGGQVVGASAGAFGLTAAFALLYPEQVLLLFFIIPLRAKYLLLFSAILAVCGMLPSNIAPGPHIADAAHLGGMLTGIVYIRYAVHWHWPSLRRTNRQPPRRLVRVHSQKSSPWGQGSHDIAEDLPPEEFVSKEVDPILDKISAQGIQSLTERERRILQAARDKIAKR